MVLAHHAADLFFMLQIVVDVLDSCGNNIDEAIKRLGNLQLSLNSAEQQAVNSNAYFPSPPLSPPPEARHAPGLLLLA